MHFTVKNRMSWVNRRVTTREEDEACCLLGICDVHMPLLYGEGFDNARSCLKSVFCLRVLIY